MTGLTDTQHDIKWLRCRGGAGCRFLGFFAPLIGMCRMWVNTLNVLDYFFNIILSLICFIPYQDRLEYGGSTGCFCPQVDAANTFFLIFGFLEMRAILPEKNI